MNARIIRRTFEQLRGQPCWGLQYDRQVNLSMNFGKPSLRMREPYRTNSRSTAIQQGAAHRQVRVRGQWWLWIYCCYWRLSSNGKELARGASSLKRIERGMSHLDGQNLTSVEVSPTTGATRFAFDLGCLLECRRLEQESDEELWLLYKPSGYVLSVYGNGTLSHRQSTVRERQRPTAGSGG